jgi:vibriolysin
MATKIFERQDSSNKVTMAVFQEQAPAPAANFTDFAVELPSGEDTANMVVIGGGATGAETPQGALLTASYPSADLSAWLVSSKDHDVSNPHRLTGFAIGLKITGMTRAQLQSAVRVVSKRSSRVAHPQATASAPAGFLLVGGGFRVNWQPGAGNLATASFPEFSNSWTARSKDHFVSSPATIDSFAICLQARLPAGTLVRGDNSEESPLSQHVEASTRLDDTFALTGIGAEVRWTPPGSLLWRLEPTHGRSQGVTAGAKDHEEPSLATVKAWAIGIRLV